MSLIGKGEKEKENVTGKNNHEGCESDSQRQCIDGSCISHMDLCPEEEMLNQETILIMIGVGMGVVLFLIMLYCLQQHRNANAEQEGANLDDVDHPALLLPPPAYDEALNVNLYPPTPQQHRRIPSVEEPTTPPPNYDAALHILAQSEENIFLNKQTPAPSPPSMRRALSVEHVAISRGRPMTFSSFGANSKTFGRRPPESQT